MNKPPILSEDELLQAVGRYYSGGSSGLYRAAKAQRDADLKWFREEVEKVENPYYLLSSTRAHEERRVAFNECRQKILSLLEDSR